MGKRNDQALQASDETEGCLKLCTSCRLVMPMSDFTVNRKAMDGYSHVCRDCQGNYRDAHRESIRATDRKRYKAIRAEVLKQRRRYYKEHAALIAVKRYAARMVNNPRRKRPPYKTKWNPEGLPLGELIAKLESTLGENL